MKLYYAMFPVSSPSTADAKLHDLKEALAAGVNVDRDVIRHRVVLAVSVLQRRREFIERVNREVPIMEQKIALLEQQTALQSYQLTTLMNEQRRRIARALAIRGQRPDTTNKE